MIRWCSKSISLIVSPQNSEIRITDHKLSSHIGFKGIFRKVLIFALVGVGHLLDMQVLGSVGVLRTAVIFFYLSNEGVSLIENAAHLGLPIPEKLIAVLASFLRK